MDLTYDTCIQVLMFISKEKNLMMQDLGGTWTHNSGVMHLCWDKSQDLYTSVIGLIVLMKN